MYKKEFIISNNDVDYRFNLKPANLYRIFQDIALKATEEVGSDSISLAKRVIDWVITRMDVEIKRLPRCNEKITVCTYPGKDLAMLYPRFFYILDEKNEPIVRASSIWALIDAKTRKVIRENLFWAFIYNSLMIPLAAGLIPIITINPMFACMAMIISSLTVTLNSLRIKQK